MNYRILHVGFWEDEFIESCTPEEKYFYLYLLTNQKVNAAGIYRLSPRVAATHTGYNEETVHKLLERFEAAGKIRLSKFSNELAIKNWVRYNINASPKSRACVRKQLLQVRDRALVDFAYGGLKDFEAVLEEPVMPHQCGIDTTEQDKDQDQDQDQKPDRNNLFPEYAAADKADNGNGTAVKRCKKPGPVVISAENVVDIYHELLPDAPRVLKLSNRRRMAVQRCLADAAERSCPEWWRRYFDKVAACAWLKGDNNSGFTADFEWLVNGSNMLKVLEGRYDRLGNGQIAARQSAGGAAQLKLLAQQLRQAAGADAAVHTGSPDAGVCDA